MNGCTDFKEILFLDIYGELDSESRSKWQFHLSTCAACKQERFRMMRLVENLKEVMSSPPLALGEREGMVRAIRAGMRRREERRSRPGWWGWLSRPWRVGPALATACVFAAILSIWSLGSFDSFYGKDRISGKDSLQGMRAEDEEIIKNLDLLSQMDSVEKLVNTLDEPEEDPAAPEGTSNTHGKTGHEKRVHYA